MSFYRIDPIILTYLFERYKFMPRGRERDYISVYNSNISCSYHIISYHIKRYIAFHQTIYRIPSKSTSVKACITQEMLSNRNRIECMDSLFLNQFIKNTYVHTPNHFALT